MAPGALDGDEAHVRIADLKSLLSLPGQSGIEIRRLYASVYASLAERKYDRALTDLNKAGNLAPEFALTKWKLALLYEAMGDIDRARENFTRYVQLTSEQSAKDEAALHLSTLDAKRTKYEEEVGKRTKAKHEVGSVALPYLMLMRSSNFRGRVSIFRSLLLFSLSERKPTS